MTIPKAIADKFAIVPGDELDWVATPDAVRVVPAKALKRPPSVAARLRLFDAATERQTARQLHAPRSKASNRGWTREELYDRGGPR